MDRFDSMRTQDGAIQLTPSEGIKNAEYFFSKNSRINEIPAIYGLLNNIEKIDYLFSESTGLLENVLYGLNTSRVKDFYALFYNCDFTTIDVSPLNTSIAERFSGIFSNCSNLTSIDLSCLDLSKVTDFTSLFLNCTNLQEIIMPSLENKSTPTKLGSMFSGCSNLKKLDLKWISTDQHITMGKMFYGCYAMEELDLRGWKSSKLDSNADHRDAWTSLPKDCKIIVSPGSGMKSWIPWFSKKDFTNIVEEAL